MKDEREKWARIRIIMIGTVFGLMFLMVVGRAFYLQILQHEELVKKAEKQHQHRVDLTPARGSILDPNSRVSRLLRDPRAYQALDYLNTKPAVIYLKKIIQQIFDANENQVKEFLDGKEKVFGFFVGQTMKATKGKANPQVVNDLLKKDLLCSPVGDDIINIAGLLADAIAAQKKLLVIADYDCDGATACAVAVRGLRAFGARIDFIVPNRFEYGYGLTPEIVQLAHESKPDILLTVDNGIASVDGVAEANRLGMQVFVTDHHLPGDTLPDAACIVNPNQPGCEFPSKHLAGVGVMFYVLLALRSELRARGLFDAPSTAGPPQGASAPLGGSERIVSVGVHDAFAQT